MVKDSYRCFEVWGLIPWTVKSDMCRLRLATAATIFFFELCCPGAKPLNWTSHSLLQCNTASIDDDLIFFDRYSEWCLLAFEFATHSRPRRQPWVLVVDTEKVPVLFFWFALVVDCWSASLLDFVIPQILKRYDYLWLSNFRLDHQSFSIFLKTILTIFGNILSVIKNQVLIYLQCSDRVERDRLVLFIEKLIKLKVSWVLK